MWSNRKAKPVLTVRTKPGQTVEVIAGEPGAGRKLLGLVLAQAHGDDMSRIALGADRAANTTHMHFFGPRDDDNPRWWDMVPAPWDAYSALVEAAIELTSFGADPSASGEFLADLNGQQVRVRLTFRGWSELEFELDDSASGGPAAGEKGRNS